MTGDLCSPIMQRKSSCSNKPTAWQFCGRFCSQATGFHPSLAHQTSEVSWENSEEIQIFLSTKRNKNFWGQLDSIIDIQTGSSFANVNYSKKYAYCTNLQEICRINFNSSAPSPGTLEIANYLPIGIQLVLGWYQSTFGSLLKFFNKVLFCFAFSF